MKQVSFRLTYSLGYETPLPSVAHGETVALHRPLVAVDGLRADVAVGGDVGVGMSGEMGVNKPGGGAKCRLS